MSVPKNIKKAVQIKFNTDELKEWWYTKFARARKARLNKLFLERGKCDYCGKELLSPYTKGKNLAKASWDHKIPTSKGGTEHNSNISLSCVSCNSIKGNMTSDEYLKYVKSQEFIDRIKKMGSRKIRKLERVISKNKDEKELAITRMAFWVGYLSIIGVCSKEHIEYFKSHGEKTESKITKYLDRKKKIKNSRSKHYNQ